MTEAHFSEPEYLPGGLVPVIEAATLAVRSQMEDYEFWTIDGLAEEIVQTPEVIAGAISALPNRLRASLCPDGKGRWLYTLADHPASRKEKLGRLRLFITKTPY